MYEDDPQDKVFDVLGEAVFGDHPLGRAIIGRAEVVAGTPAAELRAFHARALRRRSNVVVAAAGSVDHDALVELVARDRRPSAPVGAPPAPPAPPDAAARAPALLRQGDRAVPRVPRRARASPATTSAASRCACSTRSSAGRRRRGCSRRCASSAAWPTASTRSARCYAGTGQIGLYLGTRPDNVATRDGGRRRRARRAAAPTASPPRSSTAPRRTSRAACVLALESTTARMNRLGSSVLADMPLLTVDEVVDAHRRGRRSTTSRAGRASCYAPERLSAAGIGADERRLPRGRWSRSRRRSLRPHDAAGRRRRRRRDGWAPTVCDGRRGADDMELTGRADPALGVAAGRHPRRLRRRRRLHAARHGARERARPASRPACTS